VALLGLASILLAAVVLLAWILIELRAHGRRGASGWRAVERLVEPERVTLIEPSFPAETCALCGGPIGKRRESDRMFRRVWGSRVEHYHEACWSPASSKK
jgi:hypothetical protein